MSQENTNNSTSNNNEEKFVNADQSGWSSGNFPTIDLNFDIDEDEVNDALKNEQHQKKRGKFAKKGKKGEQDDHDNDHDHEGDDCCGPMLKKEDITPEMLKDAEDTYQEALGFYNEGDYMGASDKFSAAVSVLAPWYGDDDLKMVDIYYHYGDSILNLARQKILSSIVVDIDDDDDENIGHVQLKKNIMQNFGKIEEIDNDENVIEVLHGGSNDEDDGNDFYDMEDDLNFMDMLEEEVADDLEVAWDVLEMARAILTHKSGDNPDLEKLSNIHLSLGSVAVETENMEMAVKEYEECIALRKKVLGERHRKTAEAYYMLAMAYCSSPDLKIDLAIGQLTETQSILEENLKAAEEQKNEMEVIELSDLLEEVKLRIEDLKNPNFMMLGDDDEDIDDDDDDQ